MNPPARLVLFDLDHTLITVDSDEQWVEFLVAEGRLDRGAIESANHEIVARYRRGDATPVEFTEFYLSVLVPFLPEDLAAWHPRYLRERILPHVAPGTRALLARHREAGDLTVLTTATNRFLTAAIARELGFEHLIATEPEMAGGRYTGRVDGIANMREGKVARLDAWLERRGWSLQSIPETWFYSDSLNDLPLLSRVTHPVATHPDERLRAIARERGWRIIEKL